MEPNERNQAETTKADPGEPAGRDLFFILSNRLTIFLWPSPRLSLSKLAAPAAGRF
jgi:hypothetical protein